MIYSKLFEVRDRGTFIPVLATLIEVVDPGNEWDEWDIRDNWLKRRAGYGPDRCVILCRLECHGVNGNATYDPYSWGVGVRTMLVAHQNILQCWDQLEPGAVIDVEYILGETTEPKRSEFLEGMDQQKAFNKLDSRLAQLVPEKELREEVAKLQGNAPLFDVGNDKHMAVLVEKFKVPYHIVALRLMEIYGADGLAIMF